MLRILHLIRLAVLGTFPSRGRLLSRLPIKTDDQWSRPPVNLLFRNKRLFSWVVEDAGPYKVC